MRDTLELPLHAKAENISLELIVLILENVTAQNERRYFTTIGSSVTAVSQTSSSAVLSDLHSCIKLLTTTTITVLCVVSP